MGPLAEDDGSKEEAGDNPQSWKRLGTEAYQRKEWREAARCYSAALELCELQDELAVTCLNNRAACYSQLKEHASVVADAARVIERQPANAKALLRRMVALDALGRREEALADAGSVLTLEPKNPHALGVVESKRKSLSTKANDNVPKFAATQHLAVFLLTEDQPLQCYACLRSLNKHVRGVNLHVYVFWQAFARECIHSYQLLQALQETSALARGVVHWIDVSRGQLFPAFSRTITRLSVEGQRHVLLLRDTVLFHTDFDASVVLRVLGDRKTVFTARLDLNPRIDFFPEAELLTAAPHLQSFASDSRIVLWTRSYDKSKQAYEAAPRETGWDAILDWTATIIRAEHVQHFFSALRPPLDTRKDLDDKAADWLSRRQRMKKTEISPRSACYTSPILVTLDAADIGDAASADRLLRGHLFKQHGIDGAAGFSAPSKFAQLIGWKLAEVMEYFSNVDAQTAAGAALAALLAPEAFRPHYWSAARVPVTAPVCGTPQALNPPAPLVSWLIPVRNAEDFIAECFHSVGSQDGIGAGCCEIVFVEDASEDGTLSILRELEAQHPHVRLVENGARLGVAGSICEGWSHCRGDFIARLDADDEATPGRLVQQLRYLEQHSAISVLGGRTRPFWSELRKCTIERVSEKPDGRMVVVVWREFHGNQTSRRREQVTLEQKGQQLHVVDGPAEYHGARVTRIGSTPLALRLGGWREACHAVEGGLGEVCLLRRDPPEPPYGSRALHPLVARASLLFEDCVAGTTATLRRRHFDECPFKLEEAEGYWAWLGLAAHQHLANLADPLVHARRHAGNRAQAEASGIYESKLAALRQHLTKVHAAQFDLQDAAALLHFRGPATAEQGEKLREVLHKAGDALIGDFVRPQAPEGRGAFWADFVQSQEAALERAFLALRARFGALADEVARVITNGEKSPRQHRSRTPPR